MGTWMGPKIYMFRHCQQQIMKLSEWRWFLFATMPFGPSGLQKVIRSMQIGSFHVSFCFSVCYLLYNTFITSFFSFFSNTTINAQPLSPPLFEKIAAQLKTNVFIILVICVCIFFFCIFYLMFEYPLPPLGPDWSHFGPNVVLLMVDFDEVIEGRLLKEAA